LVTRRWETFVNSLAVDRSKDTTRSSITRIGGTCIVIGTKNWILDKISSQNVTSVSVAFVLLSKSLQVILWRVDASQNSITSIFGAKVDIGTYDRSVGAVSSVSITRISGTCIVIVTILSFVFAVSCGRVTRVNSAWIMVITIFWVSVETVLAVTSRDGTCI
jgi:hypothetical protein